MKKIIRGLTAAVAAIMLFSSVGMTSLAAPGKEGSQPPAQGEAPSGEAPKDGQAPKEGEQPPEMPAGEAASLSSTGEAPEKPEGEKLEGEAPKEGEKPSDAEDMTTLLEELLAVIEDIDDDETKENLQELYDAFVAALDAEKEAVEAESDEDTLEELKEAVESAREALISALDEAGIEFDLEPKSIEEPKEAEGKEKIEATEEIAPKDAEPAVNEDGSADESVEKTSPIKKIGNAIKSFFNKLFKKSE